MIGRPPRVFLSYASEDRPLVEQIRDDLALHQYEPWMDNRSLLPGQDWDAAIRVAIQRSDFFLAILSRQSAARPGVYERETDLVYELWQRKDPNSIRLIPVRLDDCPLPAALTRLHRVDYPTGWPVLVTTIRSEWRRRQIRVGLQLLGALALLVVALFYFNPVPTTRSAS